MLYWQMVEIHRKPRIFQVFLCIGSRTLHVLALYCKQENQIVIKRILNK